MFLTLVCLVCCFQTTHHKSSADVNSLTTTYPRVDMYKCFSTPLEIAGGCMQDGLQDPGKEPPKTGASGRVGL